jgi:hypothetical protein
MRAKVPETPKGILDKDGRPSGSERERIFDELWSRLSAQRIEVCDKVFGIFPDRHREAILESVVEEVRNESQAESKTKAAEDFAALTKHLWTLSPQDRGIDFELRKKALWIRSIALWEGQCRDKNIVGGETQAPLQQKER